MRMDRMRQEHAAELGLAAPAPGVRNIRRRVAKLSRPSRDRVCRKDQIEDPLGLLQPIAEAVLEDRHDAARRLRFCR